MFKLLILIFTTVFGYAFWWLADASGCSFMVSFFISGLGSMLGVWVAWKFQQRFRE